MLSISCIFFFLLLVRCKRKSTVRYSFVKISDTQVFFSLSLLLSRCLHTEYVDNFLCLPKKYCWIFICYFVRFTVLFFSVFFPQSTLVSVKKERIIGYSFVKLSGTQFFFFVISAKNTLIFLYDDNKKT